MLTWNDILNFAKTGNPEPSHKVEKTQQEWQDTLADDVFYVTRSKGTEPPHSFNSLHTVA